MKKYVFLGGYDKTDLILFLAKIAVLSNKSVLVIDTTASQKTRYTVPTMSPTQKYITTFENIDIAVGFSNIGDILDYTYEDTLNYDMVLIDIDSLVAYQNFDIDPLDEHCFVTGFDLYSIRRGLDVLEALPTPTRVTKVYFTKDMLPEEDEYVMFLSQGLKVIWNEEIIFFPFERGDQNVINTNQRFAKIKIKGLSKDYLDALEFMAIENLGLSENEVKKAIKIMEKA
jgi:hypothetical protein